jgi:hypothetical protein
MSPCCWLRGPGTRSQLSRLGWVLVVGWEEDVGDVQKPPMTKGKVNQNFVRSIARVCRMVRKVKRMAKTMARGSEGM